MLICRKLIICLLALLCASIPIFAQVAPTADRSLKVVRFRVNPNVKLSDKAVDQLMTDLVDELTGLKLFKAVTQVPAGQTVASNDHDFILMGIITKYETPKFNKYLNFGIAGNDYITATYKFVDPAAGKDILQKQVKIQGVTGLVSADWNSSPRRLSKDIARHVKKAVLKK